MKILHINTADSGGAAIAAIRIHLGLLEIGENSSFMTLYKSKSNIPNHIVYDGPVINLKPEYPILTLKNVLKEKFTSNYLKELNNYNLKIENEKKIKTPSIINGVKSFGLFSPPYSIYDITKTKAYQEADVIHLHWVADFLDYTSFFAKNTKPIVWTLHDANPFRGGFHHEDDELKNRETYDEIDRTYKLLKKEIFSKVKKMTIVSPSYWLAEDAKKSLQFGQHQIKIIRNGIDLSIFQPRDKRLARSVFNIPENADTFLIATQDLSDYRKGVDLILPIINDPKWEKVKFIIVGSNASIFKLDNVITLGMISDDRLMALVYSACDYFLLTSRTDNLPNTMLESIACGTPVISFPIGDTKQLLEDSECGILADEISKSSFEKVMKQSILKKRQFKVDNLVNYSSQNFSFDLIAKKYNKIYNKF
jgi:glycosyltransferase involved in cell wall biosynthesis